MQYNTLRSFATWMLVPALALVCLVFTLILPGKEETKQSGRSVARSSGSDVEIITHQDHAGGAKDGAFFPGGSKLITVGGDTTLRVWDTETGSLIGLYRGHETEVNAVAVSPSGTRLVSGDVEGNVLLWSYGGSDGPRKLYTHKGSVQDVVFTDDDRALSLAYEKRDAEDEKDEKPVVADLVVHDLARGRSSPSSFLAERSHDEASFVGNQYLVVVQQEKSTLYDLATWKPVQIEIPERSETGIHLLSASEMLWQCEGYKATLCAMDILTGNGFMFDGCLVSSSCRFERFFLLAADQSSRKIAFFTDSGELAAAPDLDPIEFGWTEGLHLATMLPVGNRFNGFMYFSDFPLEVTYGPRIMRHIGRIPELTTVHEEDGTIDYDIHGEIFAVSLGPAVTDIIEGSLLQTSVRPDSTGDGAFRLGWWMDALNLDDLRIYDPTDPSDTPGQLLEKNNLVRLCGMAGCSPDYPGFRSYGMSPDSRFAVSSVERLVTETHELDYGRPLSTEEKEEIRSTVLYGEAARTKVWLYHDAASVEQAQGRLEERSYAIGEVDGLWGRQTEAAVLAFQRDNHLGQTGVLDRTTRRTLGIREEPPRPQQGAGWWLEYHFPELMDDTFFRHFGFFPG